MVTLKKLIFAPLFIIAFALFIYQLNPLFSSYDIIFSLSLNTLIQFIILSSLMLLASFLFILFASLSQNWKFTLPVGGVAALIPLVLTPQPLSIILVIGTFISILLSYLTLENKLKTYLTFEANSLLGPSIRHLAGLLVLVVALTFFLSINKTIQQNGFQIPDALIDTALKFAGPQPGGTVEQQQITQSSLTKEQSDLIKQTVKDQLNNIIKPYLGAVPAVLAVILFLTLQSLTSLLGLLIYPLLWIIFYILEKSGYIKFTVEQRPVKKMVV